MLQLCPNAIVISSVPKFYYAIMSCTKKNGSIFTISQIRDELKMGWNLFRLFFSPQVEYRNHIILASNCELKSIGMEARTKN